MTMYNPPHPGCVLQEEVFIPLGLSVKDAARLLKMDSASLARIVQGREAITAEIAIRLEMAFKPSAASWVRHQAAYDLWQARRKTGTLHISPVDTPADTCPAP
jgi:addiction module HigA family antidote